ncbi:CD1108 family mobile element protein [Frisingicoccus sp.]|uniref:CD1108 family mobile element protein n=1 Tax=Frisingicoccus sp. TaxID=1918627 RepID=UPI0025C18E3E|nr:peptidoglycan DD-metalloendopeptidase family protein [Frisingicoccus sp.]
MAENKKDKSAELARDKSAFAKGGSEKGTASQKVQHKYSGTHQPRDANDTSGDVTKKEQSEAFGQNVQKSKQSAKHRNQKQYQKQDTFGHSENPSAGQKDLKSENTDAESKKKSDFSQENNTFTEDGNREQEEHQQKDDYHCRDTYHQSEKKGKYHRREYQNRERTKQSDFERDFQTNEKTFTEGMEPEFHGSKKLDRLQNKAEKAGKKTEAARKKIPKKKEYSFERVFDEKTGKAKYVLTAVEKEKQFKPDSPVKVVAGRVGAEYSNFAHGKVAEVEKENSAVEGAHKTEQTAENVYHFVKRNHKSGLQRKKEKVAKLEKKQFKKEVNFRYQKFLEENPEMQEKTLKKQMQKRLQKQRIKREYAKARRAGQTAKNTKEAAAKSASFITKVAKKIQEIASRNVSFLVTIGIFALLLIMIMTAISSCGAMFSDGMSTTLAGSYMSVPAEIDAADLAFSELEMELQKEINAIETDYPDYDEYRYNLDAIGHDPFVLISYLSAVHTEFTASDVQSEIESLFEEMYELTLNPTTETRTRTVTKTGTRTVTDPVTGEETEEEYEYEEEEEYTVTILEVTLTATNLGVVVAGHMNEEQKEIYALYNETHGLTQQFYTPLNLYWYSYVSSYYGYRINPVTGQEQFHRGVDIAVPTGTTVLAAMDGTVTTATYDASYGNYVVIEDSNGYCTKYAHMDTLNVSAGQTVTHGTTIGTTGNTGSSTGSHLHIECLYNGEYYNPLFYFDVGEGTLYGESPGGGGSPGNVIPPDSYDDATVQALMEEAARYLGYPYVWGGSSPSTSFDCSGFVCWVFTNSGVHNLPRTTAQGIYDQCTPVSAADAKAGDIIFFTGTYNSPGPVSHVGIYCGNGVMIHCGDPIKYASINTPYWQSHFYSFGRLN